MLKPNCLGFTMSPNEGKVKTLGRKEYKYFNPCESWT